MPFYTDLCDVYDALFPVSDAQRALFGELLREIPVRRAADAGCGSGAQLLQFAREGAACTGFDPDPSLAALARRKLSPYPGARVEVGGFADLRRIVREPQDLLLCLGNSLVHVPQAEAARFVADAAASLAPGGALLVQLLNYDRLRRGKVAELPPLSGDGGAVALRRRYAWESERTVRFRTELVLGRGEGARVVRNDIPLYPIYNTELLDMLARAGLSGAQAYGDYARTAFSPDSEALVCLARKR